MRWPLHLSRPILKGKGSLQSPRVRMPKANECLRILFGYDERSGIRRELKRRGLLKGKDDTRLEDS